MKSLLGGIPAGHPPDERFYAAIFLQFHAAIPSYTLYAGFTFHLHSHPY
jgi:hypothetical protein